MGKALDELSHPAYWNAHYADTMPTIFDWYKSCTRLEPFLKANLPPPTSDPLLLHLGCGNSRVPFNLATQGYTRQLCVDFSAVVINGMRALYAEAEAAAIQWRVGDVRALGRGGGGEAREGYINERGELGEQEADVGIEDGSVAAGVDKGTLDAMLHGSMLDPSETVRSNVGAYVDEVARVLKPGGVFLCITHQQPKLMKLLLTRGEIWDVGFENLGGAGGPVIFFGWVMRKRAKERD